MYSLTNCAIRIGMSKKIHAWSIKPFWAFLPGQNSLNFSIAFPMWKPYLFLKNTQSCFDHEELIKISWKSLHVGFLAYQLQWWLLEVCLTNGSWDNVCILLNNGILQKKKKTYFGLLPHTPAEPFLLSFPDEIWSLSPKNVLDLSKRKSTIGEEI